VTAYVAAVPTYQGGMMTFAWASDNPAHRQWDAETIAGRAAKSGFESDYYTPSLHVASFALPRMVERHVAA
jgi:spermidine synthase